MSTNLDYKAGQRAQVDVGPAWLAVNIGGEELHDRALEPDRSGRHGGFRPPAQIDARAPRQGVVALRHQFKPSARAVDSTARDVEVVDGVAVLRVMPQPDWERAAFEPQRAERDARRRGAV